MLRSPLTRTISTSAKLTANVCKKSKSSDELRKVIEKCVPKDYCPLPVVIRRGKGVHLYDVEGKAYLDFISGNCAISLGHCHPRICKVLCEQAKVLTHTSREVLTTDLAEYAEYVTELFSYDKVLPMTTGSEACEAAVRIAKEWGYRCKGICPNRAKIICAENNVWCPSPCGNDDRDFNCFETVPFSDPACLDYKARDPNACAFMIEPIQGEAGIIIPDPCYLKQVREICNRHKLLLIADEIQCGLGRTGCLLCSDLYRVRPDILILGKSLAAGFLPVSAVLADCEIIDFIEGKRQSGTFGGNALGCAVAKEALKTLQEENLIQNARLMGELLRGSLCDLPKDIVCEIRGVGLMNAIVLNCGINTWEVTLDMMNHGLLAKAGRGQSIRLCPPLTIKESEVLRAVKIIRHCIENSRGTCGDAEAEEGDKKNGKKQKGKSRLKYFDLNLKNLDVTSKLSQSLKKFRIN